MTSPKHLIRTRELAPDEAVEVSHPLNPKSHIFMQRLSDRVGMKRMHLTLARVPPGKESFLPHAHTLQEEFLFILEGKGRARIGDEQIEVGPGDYMGFPVDGTIHHLENVGDGDLVYLMGGERTVAELGHFPTIGKVGLFKDGVMRFFPDDSEERLPISAWLVERDGDEG